MAEGGTLPNSFYEATITHDSVWKEKTKLLGVEANRPRGGKKNYSDAQKGKTNTIVLELGLLLDRPNENKTYLYLPLNEQKQKSHQLQPPMAEQSFLGFGFL